MNAPDKPPYPGLRPFERDESQLFFGRDDCVDEMISRLAATRFLAVLGSSGTGKSSLVKTGLLTALEMGLSGDGANWRIVDFSPGRSAIASLAERLIQTDTTRSADAMPPDATQLRERLAQGGPRALIEWCREGHLESGTNLLLLVDQFEELFRYQDYSGREEAEAFVSLLLESRRPIEAEHPQMAEFPVFVAITMRSEYLGPCALIEGLAEAINEGTFLTPRMTRSQCEEAIVGPARVCGVEIEPRLVARMLNDLAKFAIGWDGGGIHKAGDARDSSDSTDQLSRLARSADQLPLMQHAMNRMWHRASKGLRPDEKIILRADDYRGLEQELNDHAESIVSELGDGRERVVETIFRSVTKGTTVWNAERRRTPYGELVALCDGNRKDVAAVVAAFAAPGAHFLTGFPTTGEPPDGKDIDISHESLIRQWKRLSKWLEKEGQTAHEWLRLDAEAEHESHGTGGLLAGRNLGNALALVKEEKRPTHILARRYGIDLERIQSFLRRSVRIRRWRQAAVGVGIVLLVIGPGWGFYQQQINHRTAGFRDASIALGSEFERLSLAWLGEQMIKQHKVETDLASASSAIENGASNRDLTAWRDTYKQLEAPLIKVAALLERASTIEPDNVALMRQHMVIVSMLSVLREKPNREDMIRERRTASTLASKLQSKKLDYESVKSIYVSLTLLSIARNDAATFDPAGGDLLDKVIEALTRFSDPNAEGRDAKDTERAEAATWLALTWLRKCNVHHKRNELDDAVSACVSGAKLAEERETKTKLQEMLWVLYDQKANAATGENQKTLRKAAIDELRKYIGHNREAFESEFGIPVEYAQAFGNLVEWAKSNWRSYLKNLPQQPDRAKLKPLLMEFELAASGAGNLARLYEAAEMMDEVRVARFLQFMYRYAVVRIVDENKELQEDAGNVERELASVIIEIGYHEGRLGRLDGAGALFKACTEVLRPLLGAAEAEPGQESFDKPDPQIQQMLSNCKKGQDWVAEQRLKIQTK